MNELQILSVAKKLISYYGPQKTTMKDVAGRLFISPSHLLNFFEDKGALIIALISSVNQDLYDQLVKKIRKETNTFIMLDTALDLKMDQYKQYFRLVHSLPYLERLGILRHLRKEFTSNNNRIAELIIQSTIKGGITDPGVFGQSLFELLEKADQKAEAFIIKCLPHGTSDGSSFNSLYKELEMLKNTFFQDRGIENYIKNLKMT